MESRETVQRQRTDGRLAVSLALGDLVNRFHPGPSPHGRRHCPTCAYGSVIGTREAQIPGIGSRCARWLETTPEGWG
ncbi:MAG TPA: hypothetical protein VKV15_23075 [Bryobacteraceae bacterium]|nr:hypothetical protein [Bryobacteraceae bacterium]